MTRLPARYAEQVYAGVLGKLIGVYLGRPIENWFYRDILKQLGPIEYFVHDRLKKSLIVSDDDITGTFTFIRALEDYAEAGAAITAEQIGQTWLNFIIENRTILWWGGVGLSTEHTAFHRLKRGIAAPQSGSAQLNGKLVSEQIGSQIFIDGWAMVSPGDPDQAAHLARLAASVSHDGEAIFAAQVIAAMEAQAFVEPSIDRLLDAGVSYIPGDSIIYRLIDDLRNLRQKEDDWQKAMTDLIEQRYGYDKFGGNCHIIPNHALIILALLWGDDDFQKSLMIANTCGWDTDCNSGNVGCLLGIKNGLAVLDGGPDWRGPIADRLYLPTADAGSCMSDAVTVARNVENLGRKLAGEPPRQPKEGVRFSFDMPGSVQGFISADDAAIIANQDGQLRISFRRTTSQQSVAVRTATFIPPADLNDRQYIIVASPTLYSTQLITAHVQTPSDNSDSIAVRLFVSHYNGVDQLHRVFAPSQELRPGEHANLEWVAPPTEGQPIAEMGLEILRSGTADDAILVDHIDWGGTPSLMLKYPDDGGKVWARSWADGVSDFRFDRSFHLRIIQNEGRGLLMYGTRDWRNYSVSATIYPVLAEAAGLAARVQGMRRYYALLLCVEKNRRLLRLVKMRDAEHVLAEIEFSWDFAEKYDLRLEVNDSLITGFVNRKDLLRAVDHSRPLLDGGVGLVIQEGRAEVGPVKIVAT